MSEQAASPRSVFGWVEMFFTYHRKGAIWKKPNFIEMKPDGNIASAAGGPENLILDTIVQVYTDEYTSRGTGWVKTAYAVTWRPKDKERILVESEPPVIDGIEEG